MIDRTEKVLGAKRLAADTADGTGKMLASLGQRHHTAYSRRGEVSTS
jgi:hypothetical protein